MGAALRDSVAGLERRDYRFHPRLHLILYPSPLLAATYASSYGPSDRQTSATASFAAGPVAAQVQVYSHVYP